ncbi:hypothetical protein IW150_005869 [Coemansia sp. RSA 2607]|nr:hypothetical protein IW150_005869 [Coemansia sp. RSA 2607]
MHLHGHSFQMVESGPQMILAPPEVSEAPVMHPDQSVRTFVGKVPMSRDTMVVPPGRYVKIRFRADNPGAWLLHCHLDIHMAMGMVMTFVEAPDVLRKTQTIPENMKEMCRRQGLRVTGNGAGKQGFDLSGLPKPPMILG